MKKHFFFLNSRAKFLIRFVMIKMGLKNKVSGYGKSGRGGEEGERRERGGQGRVKRVRNG